MDDLLQLPAISLRNTVPETPDVLIVSYRRPELLMRCLDSVREQLPNATVRVWDNHSEASTEIRHLLAARPEIDATFCTENIGFAAAVNRLMSRVSTRTALLLNPDAELLSDLSMTRAALDDPQVAAAAPWLRDAGRPWDNAHREPTLLRELVSYAGWDDRSGRSPLFSALYSAQPDKVDGYLTGACLLISMDAWAAVGPFDERYFLYGEEADWCHRARLRGLRLVSIEEEGIRHTAGGTVSDSGARRTRSEELLFENRQRYLADHHGRFAALTFAMGAALMDVAQPSKARSRRKAARESAPDFVLTSPTLDVGGAERQRVQLANALVERGFKVHLRVLQHAGDMASDLDPRVELVVRDYRHVRRDAGPDTLLVTGTTRIECAYGLAWRTLNRPHGRWVAANHAPVDPGARTFDRDVTTALRFSDGILHLANIHRAEHQAQGDLDHGVYWIIPNGVPVRQTPPARREPDGTIRFIIATRIEEHKQVDLLVEAFSEGLDDLPWTLDIWGDGSHRAAVEKAIPERLSSRIKMREWCGDVLAECAASDVYCLPSRAEAQPMVILEAMEAGICVVSSPVSSVPEVLAGGAGILVDPPTVENWRAAIRRLITDPDLRERTAAAGRAKVAEEYSVDAMTDRYVAMRQAVLSR